MLYIKLIMLMLTIVLHAAHTFNIILLFSYSYSYKKQDPAVKAGLVFVEICSGYILPAKSTEAPADSLQ